MPAAKGRSTRKPGAPQAARHVRMARGGGGATGRTIRGLAAGRAARGGATDRAVRRGAAGWATRRGAAVQGAAGRNGRGGPSGRKARSSRDLRYSGRRARRHPSADALPRFLRDAYETGMRDAAAEPADLQEPGGESDEVKRKLWMNACWTRRYGGGEAGGASELRAGRSYAAGFADGLRLPRQTWQPVALKGSASAVVPAGDGTDINPEALRELLRLPLREVIVVLEGESAQAAAAARSVPGVTVAHKGKRLERGGGRSTGARIALGDIVLFADCRRVVPAERLALLLAAVDGGANVAVADSTARLGVFRRWDSPSRTAAFMNLSLGRPELKANSVASLPHAWSAEALRRIGDKMLAVPPLAQQAAIERGMSIVVCRGVDGFPASTGAAETERPAQIGELRITEEHQAIAEHMKALKAAIALRGNRLSFPDLARKRAMARGGGER